LIDRLKRSPIFRVTTAYAIVAWVVLQLAEITFEPLGLPETSLRTLIIIVALGLPFAAALGWVLDRRAVPDAPRDDATLDGKSTKKSHLPILAGAAAAIVLLVAGIGGIWAYTFYSDLRWAQEVAQPELAQRIAVNDYFGAFELASEIKERLGETPALDPVWGVISANASFETKPSGAMVSFRRYDDANAPWTRIGTTPIAPTRVPRGVSLWRIERTGYVTRKFARVMSRTFDAGQDYQWHKRFILEPVGAEQGDVVPVQGGHYQQVPLSGIPVDSPYELDRFLIDRTEVRNKDYQAFLSAGGYAQPIYWSEPFVYGDQTLSFDQAMARFMDASGRPGPTTWIAGQFPEGKAEHPVGGISWYEAMAYARFRGRQVPTLYHWSAAALPQVEMIEPLAPALAAQSNLDSNGPLQVGSTSGLSQAGAVDMFGNVAEWVNTAQGKDKRFALGVGWPDPAYNAATALAASPWSRLPSQGVRLATYPRGELDESLLAEIDTFNIDYESIEVMSAETLSLLDGVMHDQPPPASFTEQELALPNGMHATRVELRSVYGDVLPVLLLKPRGVEPPYQTVVWFGGRNSIALRDNTTLYRFDLRITNFLRESGRMLVVPIWTGTFERNDGSSLRRFTSDPAQRSEMTSTWARDLRLIMDHLDVRNDVQHGNIGLVGLSMGAAIAPILARGDERFATILLWSGGFTSFAARTRTRTEVIRESSVVRNTTLPVLMLNGRHDIVFPLELQQAYYRMLGTPAEHKRHVVYDAGHLSWPQGEFVRENLDWLDQYLGPVDNDPRGGASTP
jgi:dienelactone hydrolase